MQILSRSPTKARWCQARPHPRLLAMILPLFGGAVIAGLAWRGLPVWGLDVLALALAFVVSFGKRTSP